MEIQIFFLTNIKQHPTILIGVIHPESRTNLTKKIMRHFTKHKVKFLIG